MWRKSALSLLGALLATGLAAQTPQPARRDSSGLLPVPDAAGPSVRPVTARDNDSLVIAIERQIRCTCGCNQDVYTCRTTDFACTTSPAMHRMVLARLDSAMTPKQVLAAFQAQYGEAIFMAPPARGFNWSAYLMPFLGLGVGLGLVVGLVRRWVRATPRGGPGGPTGGEGGGENAGATPEELAKLKEELERFEA